MAPVGIRLDGIGHGDHADHTATPAPPAPPRAVRARPVPPRQLLVRHLEGSGIELGPGHHPFSLTLPGVEVAFVDRWLPEQSEELFPHLAAEGEFTKPDIVADFNTERLDPVPDASQDFVIASHVLEHLAEPIGFIGEIHRVLRPGGTALILLPDRRRTRDSNRPPTSLEHLVDEYRSGVTTISDDHLIEFLGSRGKSLGDTLAEQHDVLERHRRRSVHVHCWDPGEFLRVLLWGVEHLGHQWAFVDGVLPGDERPPGIEFGFVLRRATTVLDPVTRCTRLQVSWETWRTDREAMPRTQGEHRPTRALGKVRRLARSYLGRSGEGGSL